MSPRHQTWLAAILLLIFGTGFREPPQLGQQAADGARGVVLYLDDRSQDQPDCRKIISFLDIYLQALNRYPAGPGGKPVHTLRLACLNDRFEATWSMQHPENPGERIQISRVEIPLSVFRKDNHSSVALLLQQELARGIPWDGEVINSVEGRRDWRALGSQQQAGKLFSLAATKKLKDRRRARFSAGIANSEAIAACAPIEIGTMEPAPGQRLTFRPAGHGILVGIDVFSSYGEFWPDDPGRPIPQDRALVYRYFDPGADNPVVRRAKQECTKQLGYKGNRSLDALLAGNFSALLSTESIELNSINQAAGLGYFTFKSGNDQRIPWGILAYVTDTVQIGDLFVVNFDIFRDIYTLDYRPDLVENQRIASHMSVGELYGNLVYRGFNWNIHGGAGFFYSKFNVPYLPDDLTVGGEETTTGTDGSTTTKTSKTVPVRSQILNPGLSLGGGIEDGDFKFKARIGASYGKSGPHLSLRLNADLMITNTWYTGISAYMMRYQDSKTGEPGGHMESIGAHIGFDLNRGGHL